MHNLIDSLTEHFLGGTLFRVVSLQLYPENQKMVCVKKFDANINNHIDDMNVLLKLICMLRELTSFNTDGLWGVAFLFFFIK